VFGHTLFHVALSALIILNVITLGLETSPYYMNYYGVYIATFNDLVLILFGIEILCRILAHGKEYFYDGWHVFDFFVVSIALLTFGGWLQIFRIFRVFWIIRLLVVSPHFKRLVNAILHAIPHIVVMGCILVVMLYVTGLIGVHEFSVTHPEEFGSVFKAMGTLTRTILMEHTWSEMYETLSRIHKYAWAYVFPVMIVLNYILLHLVVGILVTSLHTQFEEEEKEKKKGFFARFMKKQVSHDAKDSAFSHDTQAILHSLDELKKNYCAKVNADSINQGS
jgi:voltage-gated sodium channel